MHYDDSISMGCVNIWFHASIPPSHMVALFFLFWHEEKDKTTLASTKTNNLYTSSTDWIWDEFFETCSFQYELAERAHM